MAEDIFDLLAEQDEAKVKHRDWFDTKKFVLVTPENLDQCIDACIHSGKYALDLETTGLDNRVYDGVTKDRIVGVCLSHDGETGWYIPLRHRGDGAKYNIDMDVFDKAFRRLMEATKVKKTIAIFHNAKFDQEFLEFNGREPYGDWDILQSWHDTYLLAWLENSRRKKLGLKGLSKQELDIEQVELEELYPEDHNGDYDFSELDPSTDGVLWYTGGDAICTFLLFEKLSPLVLQKGTAEATQTIVYRIEKKCLLSIRWMERNRIHINTDKVLELIILGQREWLDAVETVYQGAAEILGRDVQPGYYKYLSANFVENDPDNLLPQQIMRAKKLHERMYPDPQMPVKDEEGKGWPPIYDMSSSRQLGVLFEEMKVPNLIRTEKTNQVKTSKDVLDMVIDKAEKDFPFMKKIKRFRETHRALVNYLYPMINEIDPDDHTMQINFKQPGTDTGRFATPTKDKSMDPSKQRKDRLGFPKIFMQGIPSKYDPKRPECMNRIREAITPRKEEEGDPERFIIAVDFAGVELRIVTNISREPKWMEAYFKCSSCDREFANDKIGEDGIVIPPPPRCPNCGSDRIGDLHTATGIEIYGEEATQRSDWKNLRGKSKSLNFAMCYGGGRSAAQRAVGCSLNEGSRIKRKFDGSYKGLSNWWESQHVKARQKGFVTTVFGRKYPLPDIHNPQGGFRAKAERNSTNGPVQGASADITKLAMGYIYSDFKEKGWLSKCRMIITMHDELVFECDADIIEEACKRIRYLMCRNSLMSKLKWPIPLTTDCEIGHDWSAPWDLNEIWHRECRFDGDKKLYCPKKDEDLDGWNAWQANTNFWPTSLEPWFKVKTLLDGEGQEVVVADSAPAPAELPPPASMSNVSLADPTPAKKLKAKTTNGTYTHTLSEPMSGWLAVRLAEVVLKVEGRGATRLILKSQDGQELKGWEGASPVMVNATEFQFWAREKGV